ncbi:hypothetical protein DL240_09375 [Lujinxingia litoralis]|uniref:Uncharacterized protein n=1 Tax=Lujinxingia litoralis TaxID=2211119 RepID=A0A328C736_9DELT|nr:hypothetical protein [Lujinxingia litoralis]RAL23086.1 hypothetical protein DL240_09375 [Lujinxingia litoralis]
MSEKNQELNDDEYAALLRDLEGRASSPGVSTSAEGASEAGADEDLEAFLASLEDDAEARAESGVKTATAERAEDPFAGEFEKLAKESDLVVAEEQEEEKKSWSARRAEKKAEKQAEKDAAEAARQAEKQAAAQEKEAAKAAKAKAKEEARQGRGVGQRALRMMGRVALWYGPALVLWWVVGALIAPWVSAGWLIAAMVTMFVFGLPALCKRVFQRGTYRAWTLGVSLIGLGVALVPWPQSAGEKLAHYGYWPSAVVAEVSGQPVDSALVRAHAGVSEFVGGLLTADDVDWKAYRLGTDLPLGTVAPESGEPGASEAGTEAPAPEAPASEAPALEAPASEGSGASPSWL